MKATKKTSRQLQALQAWNTSRAKSAKLGRNSMRDTHKPSAGAEYFVLAQLMFPEIDAFKCERGRAGIDLVAADTKHGTSVSIQVKSRYDVTCDGFPIKGYADF